MRYKKKIISIQGRNHWTEVRRERQAELIRARKPWLRATGPKTAQGKKRSSRNALKHGMDSAQTLRFIRLLRAQKAFMARAKALTRAERREIQHKRAEQLRRADANFVDIIFMPLLRLSSRKRESVMSKQEIENLAKLNTHAAIYEIEQRADKDNTLASDALMALEDLATAQYDDAIDNHSFDAWLAIADIGFKNPSARDAAFEILERCTNPSAFMSMMHGLRQRPDAADMFFNMLEKSDNEGSRQALAELAWNEDYRDAAFTRLTQMLGRANDDRIKDELIGYVAAIGHSHKDATTHALNALVSVTDHGSGGGYALTPTRYIMRLIDAHPETASDAVTMLTEKSTDRAAHTICAIGEEHPEVRSQVIAGLKAIATPMSLKIMGTLGQFHPDCAVAVLSNLVELKDVFNGCAEPVENVIRPVLQKALHPDVLLRGADRTDFSSYFKTFTNAAALVPDISPHHIEEIFGAVMDMDDYAQRQERAKASALHFHAEAFNVNVPKVA